MGDEREPVNCERIIHHSGSFFVWKWRSKRNQNIIMFPKMCLFKTENSGKYNIYKFLKNYANIGPKHPQTIGSTGVGRIWRSRALYLQRQTRHHSESFNGCSSHRPQSVVYWDRPFVDSSMTEKCKSPIC